MLGPAKLRDLDRPVLISLEDLVPRTHFYRHLEAKLDLAFVREWVQDCYAARGRPSIDPVVFFKLQLIMFFEGIRSERLLIEMASLNLAHRWYLGYALDETLPDHSSLTRIRGRLGVALFQRFFEHIVDLCQRARLVWGKELFFDATQVQANADADSLVPRFYLKAKAHVADLFAQGGAEGEATTAPEVLPGPSEPVASETEPGPEAALPIVLPTGLTAADEDRLAAGNRANWKLLEERRLDPERPASGSYQRLTDLRVSTTDPDAALMRLKGGGMRLGYRDHYVVDGGKARLILAALVAPADVRENTPMLDLLRRVSFRCHLRPERAVADAAYGTGENLRALEEAGIRAYIPLSDHEKSSPFYRHEDFIYDAEGDTYTCPEGVIFRARGNSFTVRARIYQAPADSCRECPVRAACTDSTKGWRLSRQFDEEYRERARAYQDTPAYQKAMRKRQIWVEPLFGEAKEWLGLRRFRLRGLPKVNCEALLTAAGQNLKRLLQHHGWGRRPWPAGAFGLPLSAAPL